MIWYEYDDLGAMSEAMFEAMFELAGKIGDFLCCVVSTSVIRGRWVTFVNTCLNRREWSGLWTREGLLVE